MKKRLGLAAAVVLLLVALAAVPIFSTLTSAAPPAKPPAGLPLSSQDSDDQAFLSRSLADLYAYIAPDNAMTLYTSYQIGLPLVDAIFDRGSDKLKAELLARTVQEIAGLPAYGEVLDKAAAAAPLTDSSLLPDKIRTRLSAGSRFDGLPLPTDARLRGYRMFPLRGGSEYQINTGNIQQHAYFLAEIVKRAAGDDEFLRRNSESRRNVQVLARFLAHDILTFYWREAPAWHWVAPYPNMRARTLARLDNAPELKARSFFRGFLDYDMHMFAIAADLVAAQRKMPDLVASPSDRDTVTDVYRIGWRVLDTRIDTAPGGTGFGFDRGLWDDNPIAQYASCRDAKLPKAPCPQRGYLEDISHAQRWPVWLDSFAAAGTPQERERIAVWQRNLARQFAAKVVHDPNGKPLLSNFLDGSDGWFLTTESRDGRNASPPSTLTGWAMRYGAWHRLAEFDPRIANAQRSFCRVITSTDPADIRFRVRYYGQPESNPANGLDPPTDEYGAKSVYAGICQMTLPRQQDQRPSQ